MTVCVVVCLPFPAVASNQAREDPAGARCLGQASIIVSVVGIIVVVVIVAISVGVAVSNANKACNAYGHC